MKSLDQFVNQVICGDCVSVLSELPSQSVDFVLTDPPYLVKYRPRDGRTCLNDDNGRWLRPAFQELYRVLKPDRFLVTFYGWPWVEVFMRVWKESGFRPVSHLVWVKSHCSREGYTKSFHEVGFLLAKGRPAKPLEAPSDILPWQYTGNRYHPNEKPEVALSPLVQAYSQPEEIVLDPFAGSGTTGVVAKMHGRRFLLIENEPEHYASARRRLGL